jgi:hypothetical protein
MKTIEVHSRRFASMRGLNKTPIVDVNRRLGGSLALPF